MYRKFIITSTILLIWMIVSCDQNSPLNYSNPEAEILSETQSGDVYLLSGSFNNPENTYSTDIQHLQGETEISSKIRSGFNPKNGMTTGPDSTGFSVEP